MSDFISVSSFTRLMHPCLTGLVTCCDVDGKPNIITIAWMTPVSVNPPLLCISVTPARYSFDLIRAAGEFVVNIAPYQIAGQALLCGRRSGRDENKFEAAGLMAKPAQRVRPPIIAECVAHVECRLVNDVEAGDHHLFIGEALAAYARADALNEKGMYDLARTRLLFHVGGDVFTTTSASGEAIALPPDE